MNRFLSSVLVILIGANLWAATVGGDKAPDGQEQQCFLPKSLRMKNVGGSDGAGLCVFTSINHAAIFQDVYQLREFQKWMKSHPGGGYPEKVDKMIEQLCKEKGWPKPRYVQNTTGDLEIIRKACRGRRMVSVTYGVSPSGRYGGSTIAHMVNCTHALNGVYGILDNNYIEAIEWLDEEEFKRAFNKGGTGWSVVLLEAGPPKKPRN